MIINYNTVRLMASDIYGKYSNPDDKIVRLVTYRDPLLMQRRTGLVIGSYVLDLNIGAKLYLLSNEPDIDSEDYSNVYAPLDMITLIRRGKESIKLIDKMFNYYYDTVKSGKLPRGPNGEIFIFNIKDVKIDAPIPRPGKIIHTAGNFREHAKEAQEAGWPFPIPQWISFLKNPDAVVGHDDNVIKPKFTKQLDHELELAIIIGKKCKNVSPEGAKECIFGFTVFNDITARDIQREEMKNGLLNFGKNLDTFAVFGPTIVPINYIGDYHNLTMELRVNGDVRQFGSTKKLSVKIEEIVSKYSWVTLYPGDIISTGTISGVAAFRKPDPTPFFLKHGDILESEIEKIGVVRNVIKED
jgi:2-keto-4-pentenoate hydratase/2-oxohepta-3-ene-1,7-dioic acid hydratase in catechol pathway